MKKDYDFDLFVIGGGSGGVRSARWSAQLGAKVAICEESRFGGTCVIKGCIPKKLMSYASHFSQDFKHASEYGYHLEIKDFNYSAFVEKREAEIERLSKIYRKLLINNSVEIIDGRGILLDPHTVQVSNKNYTAKHILICTGGRPSVPKIEGHELLKTSDQIFQLKKLPEKIAIWGGGYIALEFASIFNGLGTHVDLIIRKDHVLNGFDQELREFIQNELIKKGIVIHTHAIIDSAQKRNETIHVTLSNKTELLVDEVLAATGRVPNISNMNLENCGVEISPRKSIVVDQHMQTSVKSIFAVGDVCNEKNLTPVALEEGMIVAENLFNKTLKKKLIFNDDHVPSAVFSSPPISTVGLSEEEAKKGGPIDVYTSTFRPLMLTLTSSEEKTFMKLIVRKKDQKIIGLHVAGKDAPEIVQGFAVAIRSGATKQDFDHTIGIHPTSAEELTTMRTVTRSF